MEEVIQIQINEINRLMNYDRSKTLLEQGSADFMVDRASMRIAGVDYEDYKKEVYNVDIDKLASLICGDDSPFAGLFEIPWIEYKSEELFCDFLAPILAAFGPVGIVAGLSIEFLHAKDLWNKGDKFGAVLSMTIGLLPIFGDLAAKSIRNLVKKIGNSGFVKVISVLTRLIKFLSGDLKASNLWGSFSKLSTDERELFNLIISISDEVLDRTQKLIPELESIKSKLSNIPFLSEYTDESIENIIDILKNGGIFKTLGDAVAQFGGIMGLIFTAEFLKHIGFSSDEELSEERIEEINKIINDPSSEYLESGAQIFKNNE